MPTCGVVATKVHAHRQQVVRDVPVAGAVQVVWAKRRWVCRLGGATQVGNFSEQNWVLSNERHQMPLSGSLRSLRNHVVTGQLGIHVSRRAQDPAFTGASRRRRWAAQLG
ncbi:MAG: transposase family protein [Phycicoccus sp.]|nr:transposase family protein [Phycicoccus sp.]